MMVVMMMKVMMRMIIFIINNSVKGYFDPAVMISTVTQVAKAECAECV